MTDLKKLTANLEKKGYIVRYFDTPQEAADYLDSRINGKTVAFGWLHDIEKHGAIPQAVLS